MDIVQIGENTLGLILLIVCLCAFEIMAHLSVSLKLLKSVGVVASARKIYHILMAGQCANAITPFRAGFPIRVVLYRKIFGLDTGKGAGIVFVETVFLLIAVFSVAIYGLIYIFTGRSIGGMVLGFLMVAVVLVTGCVGGVWLQKNSHTVAHFSVLQRVTKFYLDAVLAIKMLDNRVAASSIFLFISSLLAQGLRLSLVFLIFSISVSPLALASAITIAYAAGTVSMLPFGIGVRDSALAVLLASLGLDISDITIALVAQRLFSPGLYVALGIFSYYSLIHIFKEEQASHV